MRCITESRLLCTFIRVRAKSEVQRVILTDWKAAPDDDAETGEGYVASLQAKSIRQCQKRKIPFPLG